MSTSELESLDPMSTVLEILKLLRTAPEDSAAMSQQVTRLSHCFRRARAELEGLANPDLSLEDQREIIDVLTRRIARKRLLLERINGGRAEPAIETKLDAVDIEMTG